jgi:hypothetical protein
MKFRIIFLILLTVFILTCGIALGESSETDSIGYGEWNWDNESVNEFSGSVDVSQWNGTELIFLMKAYFEPESESASEVNPKFTHFNGKRLPMLKQSNSFTFTPGDGQTAVAFEGSLQMPEKDHYQKITIDLTVTDPDGKELKKISAAVLSAGGNNAVKRGNIFYIPFEIRTVAIYIFAAAAIVWCLAVVRNRVLNKKTLQEKKTYADL